MQIVSIALDELAMSPAWKVTVGSVEVRFHTQFEAERYAQKLQERLGGASNWPTERQDLILPGDDGEGGRPST